ncbi:hypothetical protein G6F46_007084 [Rhizopus delemar]|uniref:Uncharacterized protein n=2 Tax=Rhizopus TaxID=4842 RepID=A0A9P6Z1X8_9FUNG|nr:hypothetical protein G6F36_014606 [Rhizopus arrhizus]KAG1457746.1 hypothetical protein G6F55_005747 [Rhizopus delemar]KAG1496507.1 hypothetical protein G6F54_006421 [Rhizopus delemar]KAG1505743.1 hypothetical protein G6F52_012059 [Rhizopus delemar]KAG1516989.1 hypothetical protein G6F53_001739 [Rhizopus delemar]
MLWFGDVFGGGNFGPLEMIDTGSNGASCHTGDYARWWKETFQIRGFEYWPTQSPDLQRILNYNNHYKLFADNTVAANVNIPFMTMTNKAVEDIISDITSLFIDSIIDFENIKICVTSGDILLHNHFTIDDYAYGENGNDLHRVPTAVVRERSYLSSTTYYELSIYWGFIELLVTDGFYVEDHSPNLFLGSSLRFWKHGELTSNEIYIMSDSSKETYTSPRLLNQYN